MIEISGIIPPIVTPLTSDYKINEKVLRKMINHLIENGVHGIFPAGTTGEFYALTNEEYKELLEITVDETKGRVPVYGGVNHITTRGAIKLAEIAQEAGVDALSILTPMFISPSQKELYLHYKNIAENIDLPIILYNNAPKTGVTIAPEMVQNLADIKNIVAIKDSTGDMTNTEECLRLTKDREFSVLMGRDTLIYAGLAYGATGAIASCANVAPKIAVDIYDKYIAGDLEAALEAQYRLAPLRMITNLGTFPAVIKEGLKLQGFDVGPCYEPIKPLLTENREILKNILIGLELI